MITIYTDGSCLNNPGNGGWAAIINVNDEIKKISGCVKDTTNNKMELMAPIKALQEIKEKQPIEIYTDSQYVRLGITDWVHKWIKNNWQTSKKEKDALNILCRGAALRYLLTRIYDYFNTPKTALIQIKDPNEYLQKLIIHNQLNNYTDYYR